MRSFLLVIFAIVILSAGGFGYILFLMPNIAEKRVAIKIPTGSDYEDVLEILRNNKVLKNENSFSIVSDMKKYSSKVKPGYYVLTNRMNNRQIVNMLMAGLQTPVTLVIYNIRTKEEFASLIGRTLELDSNKLLEEMNSESFCKKYDVDTNTVLSRIIVDNYEFYWNVPKEKFWVKIEEAYKNFWNEGRLAKAEVLGLTPEKVTTLASIVEREVMRERELPTVAGVYLNRLRIGMPLQADPTLVFALRDFDARRVNSTHKEYDTPFNTYLYAGLPPGQICMPRKKSIDAVLNYESHNYLYFCANPDMSGYSVFSKTYSEQMEVAARYRKKLDELNVH